MHLLRTRTHPVRGATGIITATALLLALLPATPAEAAPTVEGGGTIEFPYTEQHPPIAIGTELAVSGGGTYDGQYIEFEVATSQGTEALTLATDDSASTEAGVVSVVGSTVYLGNGTDAEAVGSVDEFSDGTEGSALRVNFSSPFANPSFEGSTDGWTILNQRIDLGVTEIAGFISQDTSVYPGSSPNADNNTPNAESFTAGVSTVAGATDGSRALELSSGISTALGFDVVHGPAAVSSPFPAAADDVIYFDWRAFAGSDAYHVFGYLLDADGNQVEVLDSYTDDTSGSTDWATKATTIPANGTYRFVFVAGTFDASGGQAAGARLYIDNVRVFGNKVTDAVVQQVARKLQFSNDSDNPPATQTVNVIAVASDSTTGSDSITINITAIDDAPTMGAIDGHTYVNAEGTNTFADHVASLPGTDPEGDPLTYSLAGSTATAVTIAEVDYTHSADGAYGTMYMHETTGAVRYVADVAAFNAQSVDATDEFSFTVSANDLTDSGTLTITLDVPPTAPNVPGELQARALNGRVDLAWTAPTWLGDAAVTGYRIESSLNGDDWTLLVADTATTDTAFTVEDLDNGVEMYFRVSAINANGVGDPSDFVTATPRAPTPAPSCEYNESSFSSTLAGWEIPCWVAPSTTEPATDAVGWVAEPSAFAIANGLITPASDGTVQPETAVSRSDMARMLLILAGNPEVADNHGFQDAGVAEADALNWLTSIGVVEGVGEGRFDGERTVTRAEAVVLVWRLAGRPAPDGPHDFDDVSEDWMTVAVAWAEEQGIVNGRAPGVFDPFAGVTRGELFAILYRWTNGIESAAS